MAKPTIFISYSHKDEEWKNRLATQLGVLQQQGYLDIWVDTRIEGGADWFREIKEAIEATSIAVLLISADFLNSKFITEQEVPMLLQQQQQKGLRIFPIILKPCDWLGVPWIAKSMARPKDGRPLSAGNENQIETDLAAIATEIRELLQKAGLPQEKREYVPLPPDQVSLSKLPTTQHALFGRDKELKLLDDAWQNPHCHLLSFVAFGGVGKTALVNEWLNQMELDNWRGAERVYGWSFYSQGSREDKQASADTFFEDALAFFGYTGEPITSPWDKGKLLASLIKERKTLLILDGLEPLQYPPGVEEGRLRDQGLQALLKELARFNNGLCTITTRCRVEDIEHTVGKTTHCIELENLSPDAGRQLLREVGVTQGTDRELEQTAKEYGCHALALSLLGSYVATVYDGEIRKRDLIPQLTEEMKHGGHARRVMESYEIWLKGTAELEILYLMGLFDRPAPLGAIDVLIKKKRIKGLTDRLHNISDKDWRYAVKHLRDLRLLSASRSDTLDCHPLIREHFSQKLKAKNQRAWQKVHSRLYEYYMKVPKKKLPDTLEEMEPLFAAVAHGCQAGKYWEAEYDVYVSRIKRGSVNYSAMKLGAFGADLSVISNFFEIRWSKPVSSLPKEEKATILNWASFRLSALGRLREAAQTIQAANEMAARNKEWQKAASGSGNLSQLYLTLGDVEAALSSAHQSADFANRSGDEAEKLIQRTKLANVLHQKGELAQAEAFFEEAEGIHRKRQPERSSLYSIPGFWYCDLLLNQGKVHEVIERARKTVKYESEGWYNLIDTALDKLSLGGAHLLQTVLEGLRYSTELSAMSYLNQAVTGLRESAMQHQLPRGLFARAFCYRVQYQFRQAWDDLDEAREIAERGSMNLWLVDYHLEAARLVSSQLSANSYQLFEQGREVTLNQDEMIGRLKLHVETADKLVQKTGYHRRDPEVELGYAGLFIAQGNQIKAREHLGKAKALLDKMGIRCWDFYVEQLSELSSLVN